jgi:E3 ubiquitin-protein ligase UBR7
MSELVNDNTDNENENENDVYSLQELMTEERKQYETANAVLGASDATNCSYANGYIYRQALFCCVTCMKEAIKEEETTTTTTTTDKLNKKDFRHGFCLACSYSCHANHEVLELYTKRNFACDCGNSKFSKEQKCKLNPNKEPLNINNKYNHNFEGLYCSCERPYPEGTSSTGQDQEQPSSPTTIDNQIENDNNDMIQCTICEDWFHSHHLPCFNQKQTPNEDEYDEMICPMCMSNNDFLWNYQSYLFDEKVTKQNDVKEESIVGVESKHYFCYYHSF